MDPTILKLLAFLASCCEPQPMPASPESEPRHEEIRFSVTISGTVALPDRSVDLG